MRRVTAGLVAVLGVLVVMGAHWPSAVEADDRRTAGSARAVLPVEGPIVRPFDPPTERYGAGHRGVDIAAAPGTPVVAALPGTVTFSGAVARRGWVTVDHGGGLDTTYGTLDPRGVTAGQRVAAGQELGRLAAGVEHLDWGARLLDEYIDPLRLLGRWRPHLVRLPR